MKKGILIAVILAFTSFAYAQIPAPRSIIKTNLLAYTTSTINLNYEYKVAPKFSVGLITGYTLPVTRTLDASGTSSSGKATYNGEITPQGFFVNPYARWYPKDAMTGFYMEAFTRFSSYTFDIPYDYEKDGATIQAAAVGTANTVGGGLVLGTQVPLGPMFVLDFYLGAGMGLGNAHAETDDPQLDAQDFADIKAEMDQLEDVQIIFIGNAINDMTYDANSTSAWADVNNYPIPILRAGISFGYMF